MYLEALHKKFKYCHLDGKKNRRLDKCVSALMRLFKNIMFERLIRQMKSKPTSRMSDITANHRKSTEIPASYITLESENRWTVQSSKSSRFYIITVNVNSSCRGCPLSCPLCSFCIHQVSCTCRHHVIGLHFCKHIHACLQTCKRDVNFSAAEPLNEEEVRSVINQCTSQSSAPVGECVTEITRLRTSLDLLNGLAMQITGEFAQEASAEIDRAVKKFKAIAERQKAGGSDVSMPVFKDLSKVAPANKKVEKQLRYFSTRKSRKPCNPETTLSKPRSTQTEVLKQIFVNSQSDEEHINIANAEDGDHQYI